MQMRNEGYKLDSGTGGSNMYGCTSPITVLEGASIFQVVVVFDTWESPPPPPRVQMGVVSAPSVDMPPSV